MNFDRSRTIGYENLRTNYSYGSLAVDDFWEPEEVEEAPAPKVRKKKFKKRFKKDIAKSFYEKFCKPLIKNEKEVVAVKVKPYKSNLVKTTVAMCIGLFMFTYLLSVIIGQMMMAGQMELVNLQRTETELLNEANELSIRVEQLKGPERIRNIACNDLGMVVARDNVYVPRTQMTSIREMYGKGNLQEENKLFAYGK